MDRRLDLVWALAVFALGATMTVVAVTAPAQRVLDILGPFGVPMVIGVAMAVLAAVQAFRAVSAIRAGRLLDRHEGSQDDDRYPSDARRGAGFIFGSFVYIALLEPVGYLLLTPLAAGVGLWALGYRSRLKLLLLTVGFTIVSFTIFSQVMSIPIPVGPLRQMLIDAEIITRFR